MPRCSQRSRHVMLLWCFLLLSNLVPPASASHAQDLRDAADRFGWQRSNVSGRRTLPTAPSGTSAPVVVPTPVDQHQRLTHLQARAAAEQTRAVAPLPLPVPGYHTYLPMAAHAITLTSPAADTAVPLETPAFGTASSKVYRLPNGLWRTEVFPRPVQYQQDGQWLPFAPILQTQATAADDTPRYRVAGTDLDLQFAAPTEQRRLPADRHLVELRAGELSIGFTPQHVRLTDAAAQQATITYHDILPGMHLRYTATGPGLKEDVLLTQPPAADFALSFAINVGGGSLVQDGSRIVVNDRAGHPAWVLSAPFLLDARGSTSTDVQVTLTPGATGAYTLTYTPSAAWLADPARAYPVTLDPTLEAYLSGDTYAASDDAESDTHHTENALLLGRSSSGEQRRIYIQFDVRALPAGVTPAQIVNAQLRLYQVTDERSGSYPVTIQRTVDPWAENSVNWRAQPQRAAVPQPISQTVSAGAGPKSLDITAIVRGWYNDPQPTPYRGLALFAADENQRGGRFTSYNCVALTPDCHSATHPNEFAPSLTYDFEYPVAQRNELYLTQSLQFTPSPRSPRGTDVTATFTVKNTGPRAVYVPRLRVALTRLTSGADYAFRSVTGIVLAPGQSYTYSQRQTLADAGLYTGTAQFFNDAAWARIYVPQGSRLKNVRDHIVQAPKPPRHARTLGTRGKNGRAGEPVNTSTGNYTTAGIDLTLADVGPSITLGRTFNSLDTATAGSFGPGWAATYDQRLIRQDDESVVFVQDDGQQVYFEAEFNEVPSDQVEDQDGDVGTVAQQPTGNYQIDPGFELTLKRDLPSGIWTLTEPDQTRRVFDGAGRLLTITDRYGATLTTVYSNGQLAEVYTANQRCAFGWVNARITSIACPSGSLRYSYDGANRLHTMTDLGGAVTSYRYNDQHQLTSIVDGAGRLMVENVYDASGRVIQQREGITGWTTFSYGTATRTTTYVDANGQQLTDTYDDRDRLLQRTDALGHTERYSYDDADRALSYTNALDATWRYSYDQAGNLLTETDPLGATWRYQYSPRNLLTSATDPLGHTTSYSYSQDRLAMIENALGGRRTYETTLEGRVLRETDELGQTTRRSYTATGQLASETDATGAVTTYAYSADGDLAAVVDALGQRVRYSYDRDHRLTQIEAADGSVTLFAYDALGNLIRETNPLGATRQLFYDGNHRLIGETDFTGAVTEYVYDQVGRLVQTIDALNQTTALRYDMAGRLMASTDRTGATWSYSYDAAGQLVTETDPLGRKVQHQYDASGRELRTVDARGNASEHTYDSLGRVLTETSLLGAVTTIRYDALGRRISVTDGAGQTTRFGYDATGRALRTIDALGNVATVDYDASDRPIQETDRLGAVTLYRYDALGRQIATTDPRGAVTRTSYDAHDRPVLTVDALGNRTATVYDAAGRRIREIDARGVTRHWTYDAEGRMLTATDGVGATTRSEYDAEGRTIRVIDALGGERRMAYDAEGRLTAETNAAGQTRTIAYDAVGNALRVTDARGFVTTTAYDPNDNPIRTTDPLGYSTSSEYNAASQVVREIDALGNVSTTEYDALGRMLVTRDPYGATSRTEYDELGRVRLTVDPRGATARSEYDAEGRAIRTIDALGQVTATSYDALGLPLTVIDPLGRRSSAAYDLLGRTTATTDPQGQRTRSEYDALGNLVRTIDPRGAVTAFRYDYEGRQIAQVDALNQTTRTEYDLLGRATRTIDPLGQVTLTEYDAVGNQVKQIRPGGQVTRLVYDAASQLIAQMDARGFVSTWAVDARGQQTAATDPLGHTTRREYDAAGNLVAEIAASGQRTRMTYDKAHRLSTVSDPLGNTVRLRYDAAGALVETLDGNGRRRRTDYDLLGRPTAAVNALGQRTRWSYDAVGNQVLEQRSNQTQIATEYDALDRPVVVAPSIGATETITYDPAGNVTVRSGADGPQTTDYDLLGRPVRMTDSAGQAVQWRYDAASRRTATIYPDGRAVTTTYDANGWPTRIVDRLGNPIDVAHDADGRLLDLDYPASATRWAYDSAGRVTGVLNAGDNGAFAVYEYTLDANDNRTAERISTLTLGGLVMLEETAYGYDDADRLITSVRAGPTTTRLEQRITYDAAGNRTAIDALAAGIAWSQRWRYDSADQLIEQIDSRTGSTRFTYDAAGQRLSATGSAGQQQYRYDAYGRLVSLTALDGSGTPLGSQVSRYDGLGRRVVVDDRAPDGSLRSSERTLYDGESWELLAQTTSGQAPTWFVASPAELSHLGVETAGAMRFAHTDGLGSYVAFTDRTGRPNVELPTTYGDWGAIERGADAQIGGYGYSGHRHEASGLLYARNRYYDPATATWITPDPFPADETAPGSLNRYSYVRGNPITRTDPLGLFDTDLGLDAAVGAFGVRSGGAGGGVHRQARGVNSAGSHAREQRESTLAHNIGGVRCGSRCGATYTVKRGDTLGEIAARFHVPARRIAHANRQALGPDRQVDSGETLYIPCDDAGTRGGRGNSSLTGNRQRHLSNHTAYASAAQARDESENFLHWLRKVRDSKSTKAAKAANKLANKLPGTVRGRKTHFYYINKAIAYGLFAERVGEGRPWDIKRKAPYNSGRPVQLGERIFSFDGPGNILYAYAGRLAGFSENELRTGSVIAQLGANVLGGKDAIVKGLKNEYMCDQDGLTIGFRLYNEFKGGNISYTQFSPFTVTHIKDSKQYPFASRNNTRPGKTPCSS